MSSLMKVGSTSQAVVACCSPAARSFSVSAASAARRRVRDMDDPLALRKMEKFKHDDVPMLGHMILEQRRAELKRYRTIEFEIPKLAAFRQTYVPPKENDLLKFRFQHYQGAEHPGSRKVTLTVDISRLFASKLLETPEAKHKFLLIAGSRFHADNPVDVAQKTPETINEVDGHLLISCEKMPADRQNMKWCSDTFDTMVKEANQASPELQALPIDTRHTIAREQKKMQYLRRHKPTLNDFPQHWL